jgi:hypothetical protein
MTRKSKPSFFPGLTSSPYADADFGAPGAVIPKADLTAEILWTLKTFPELILASPGRAFSTWRAHRAEADGVVNGSTTWREGVIATTPLCDVASRFEKIRCHLCRYSDELHAACPGEIEMWRERHPHTGWPGVDRTPEGRLGVLISRAGKNLDAANDLVATRPELASHPSPFAIYAAGKPVDIEAYREAAKAGVQ